MFECSEKCSKEDVTEDWNSSPIYGKYPDEDCGLCKQVLEDESLSLFKYKRLLILQKRDSLL